MNKTAVIYAYYEKNNTYIQNLRYFLEHAIISSYDIHYYIIVNGICSIMHISQPNVTFLTRPNEGFDFGAFGFALDHMKNMSLTYNNYIFINSSCRGPFTPAYMTTNWVDAFTSLLKGNVKLVGPTINLLPKNDQVQPHVQSYCFAIDNECMLFLTKEGLFSPSYTSIYDVIDHQELGLSALVLKNGWNIDCFVAEYRNRDYHNVTNFNPKANSQFGDILFPGKLCFGRDIHPYEVMFIKTERGLSLETWKSLSESANVKRA